MVLYTLEAEKERLQRERRTKIEEQNKELAKQKKEFDVRERTAYRSYDHIEVHTGTKSLRGSPDLA